MKDLVQVKAFFESNNAYIAKALLESNGIETHIFDSNINTVNPFNNIATGGIKLMVPETDIKAAKELIASVDTKDTPHWVSRKEHKKTKASNTFDNKKVKRIFIGLCVFGAYLVIKLLYKGFLT